jgi:hypothetical protein
MGRAARLRRLLSELRYGAEVGRPEHESARSATLRETNIIDMTYE